MPSHSETRSSVGNPRGVGGQKAQASPRYLLELQYQGQKEGNKTEEENGGGKKISLKQYVNNRTTLTKATMYLHSISLLNHTKKSQEIWSISFQFSKESYIKMGKFITEGIPPFIMKTKLTGAFKRLKHLKVYKDCLQPLQYYRLGENAH